MREAPTPEPVALSTGNKAVRTLPQPDTVTNAQVLIHQELAAREREVTNVPGYRNVETRPAIPALIGHTGHHPKTRPVPKLGAPKVHDVEGAGTAERIGARGASAAEGHAGVQRLQDTLGLSARGGDRSVKIPRDGDNEQYSRTFRASIGYAGHTPRLGAREDAATQPPPASYQVEREALEVKQQPKLRAPGADSLSAPAVKAPISARYYVPSLTLPPPEQTEVDEQRFHIPGYSGTIRGEKFKIANSFGDMSRHQLTKPETQTEGHQPPVAYPHIGMSNDHLDGQYFKLPNKLGAINQYGAAKSANSAIVMTANDQASVTSNRTITKRDPPIPTEYPLWTDRKASRTLPPPLDTDIGTMNGFESNAMTPRTRSLAMTIPRDDPEQLARKHAIGTVHLTRHPEKSVSSIKEDMVGKKNERTRDSVNQALDSMRRYTMALQVNAEPPKKSQKEKEIEHALQGTPRFDRDFSPKSTGHLPGYQGHVPKDINNIEHTLAHRSLRNFSNPFNPGFGTRDGTDLDTGFMTQRTRNGPAELISTFKQRSKGRPDATFVDDPRIRDEFPTRADLMKNGRTHVNLDPTIHTDAKRNVITTGHGGYPPTEKQKIEETEERKHIPNYTGHVPRLKFKFANSYSDTTMHILTKPEHAPKGDVPFNAKPGQPRPEYEYTKITNVIESNHEDTLHKARGPIDPILGRGFDVIGGYSGYKPRMGTKNLFAHTMKT